MRILSYIDGDFAAGVKAVDIIMKVAQVVGDGGTNGYAVEFTGSAVRALPRSERITIYNMAVVLVSRAASIAADDKGYRVQAGKAHSETPRLDREEWAIDANEKFDIT